MDSEGIAVARVQARRQGVVRRGGRPSTQWRRRRILARVKAAPILRERLRTELSAHCKGREQVDDDVRYLVRTGLCGYRVSRDQGGVALVWLRDFQEDASGSEPEAGVLPAAAVRPSRLACALISATAEGDRNWCELAEQLGVTREAVRQCARSLWAQRAAVECEVCGDEFSAARGRACPRCAALVPAPCTPDRIHRAWSRTSDRRLCRWCERWWDSSAVSTDGACRGCRRLRHQEAS